MRFKGLLVHLTCLSQYFEYGTFTSGFIFSISGMMVSGPRAQLRPSTSAPAASKRGKTSVSFTPSSVAGSPSTSRKCQANVRTRGKSMTKEEICYRD